MPIKGHDFETRHDDDVFRVTPRPAYVVIYSDDGNGGSVVQMSWDQITTVRDSLTKMIDKHNEGKSDGK